MRKNSIKGNIILLSSIYGVVAQDSEVYKNTKIKVNSIYSAVKGALINHTKQLASYYGQFSIRVNIISPGGIKGKIAGKRNKHSSKFIKNYREYVDDIAKGIVIKAKRMSKNGDDIDSIIDYISETLKNKLAHDTTIKLRELYPHLDEDKVQRLNDLFKEN